MFEFSLQVLRSTSSLPPIFLFHLLEFLSTLVIQRGNRKYMRSMSKWEEEKLHYDHREGSENVGKRRYSDELLDSGFQIATIQLSVYDYLRKQRDGKILVRSDFQRNVVWTKEQMSRFIESMILDFPLPPIYLNENREAKYIVIDGLQRTSTLMQFFDNQWPLCKLQILSQFNGREFRELPVSIKSRLESKQLTMFLIKPSTPIDLVYDLFERINAGGTALNRQELRNGIFSGNSTMLLRQLAESTSFKIATDNGISSLRMKDQEVVLRYLAFRWIGIDSYTGNLGEFLDNMMMRINQEESQSVGYAEDFDRVMKWAAKIWDNNAFRIPTAKNRGVINTALFESIGKYLSLRSDKFLQDETMLIRRNYSLLVENKEFLQAISVSTGTKKSVMARFTLSNRILDLETHSHD